MITSDIVKNLKPFVNFITICPEVEIGLGVPRDPIRIIEDNGGLKLFQPSQNIDVTDEMSSFSESFLSELKGDIDGFILKSRSPSCGIKDVKVYKGTEEKTPPLDYKVRGFFGNAVIEKFAEYPVEDEGRLLNFTIREHFLTTIFTYSRFRTAKISGEIKDLIDFHTHNKYLFMAYNQVELKTGGNILANHKKKPYEAIVLDYENCIHRVFSRIPQYTSNINVLMHLMGYYSNKLSGDEKKFFLEEIEKYRNEKLPLSALTSIISAWAIRFSGNDTSARSPG
jgi:uncharacterized protein YbgA (DUF1722 family)/uncharacterized protein YbbK (DUF523 family)